MRKLPTNFENPVDNFIYLFVPSQSKLFDKLSPNMITTISVIFSTLSIYYFIKDKYELSTLFYILSYFYDCVDGFHARRKNQVTTFGDYYDHMSDNIANLIFFYLLYNKFKNKNYFIYIIIFITIFNILMYCHLTLQEIYYDDKPSSFLNILQIKDKKLIKYINFTKFFGCGTAVVLISSLILFSKYSNDKI